MLENFQWIKSERNDTRKPKRLLSPSFKQLNSISFKLFLILIINFSSFFHQYAYAQDFSIEATEAEYKSLHGLEKLKALNILTEYYYQQQSRKALKYGRQAVILGENIFVESNSNIDFNERDHLVQAYVQLEKYFLIGKIISMHKKILKKQNHWLFKLTMSLFSTNLKSTLKKFKLKLMQEKSKKISLPKLLAI